MTTTTTTPATADDFERILAEMRRLLRRASPAVMARVRAEVRELQAEDARARFDGGETAKGKP
jgi:hypothetical protein